jgi:GntR family transcriptional regulator
LLILVDPHSGVPVYRQVVDQVRFQIATGRLAPGTELPSTRALSLKLGVNPMTISKAYGILEEEGIVLRRPGLALVVKENARTHSSAAKLDQLEIALQPAVRAAIQLGIPTEKAGILFRKLLDRGRTKSEESE